MVFLQHGFHLPKKLGFLSTHLDASESFFSLERPFPRVNRLRLPEPEVAHWRLCIRDAHVICHWFSIDGSEIS